MKQGGPPVLGTCPLCLRPDQPLMLDHCHRHEVERGRICNRCNTLMGTVDCNGKMTNGVIRWSNPDAIEPYLRWYERCQRCGPVTRRIRYKYNRARQT